MGIQASAQTAPDTPPVDDGLRSLGGIRWLLLAGALLTGVSAYRLVETRWDLLPAAAQYLVLCGGALAVYGIGQVARKRLALRVAGGALLSLFVALIPILAWGAAYLHLLARPLGLAAFLAGMGALLAAARQVLFEVVRYRGALYPAALAILAAAPPVLPILTAWLPGDVAFLLSAGLLGLVFHAGSRHVNRFLFHRDRRDGLDRPLHALPFVGLGLLYAAACASLPGGLAVAALPVAIAAIVLVDTGEEYHRALTAILDAPPARWPKRSVALLSVGFSLLAGSFAMAFARPDGPALDLVALLAAARLVGWGFRYDSPRAHVAGVLCALAGYNLSPVLYRPLARLAVAAFTGATGIASGSPGLASFGDLGFLALLLLWGTLLRRREASERMQRTHAIVTALHALATIGFALPDLRAALLFLPLVAVVLGAGLLATRRLELLLPLQTALAAASMVIGATVSRAASVLVPSGSLALALGSLVLTGLGRLGERRLARSLGLDPSTPARLREALAAPPLVVAVLAAGLGLATGDSTAGALALIAAGAALLSGGARIERRLVAALGVIPLSLGAHLLPAGLALASPLVPGVTLVLLAVSWAAVRAGERVPPTLRPAGRASLVLHAVCGLLSLLAALTPVLDGHVVPSVAHFGLRPLIVAAIGLVLVERGLVERSLPVVTLGLGLLVVFPAFGFWACGVLDTIPRALLVTGLTLALLRLPLRAAAPATYPAPPFLRVRFLDRTALDGPLTGLTHAWCALAVLLDVAWSGTVPLAVALLVVLHLAADAADRPLAAGETFGIRHRLPLALLLPVALHLAALSSGAPAGALLLDLRAAPVAAAALGWLLAVDAAGGRASDGLKRLSALVEALSIAVTVGALAGELLKGGLTEGELLVLLLVALGHAARDLGLAWRERVTRRAFTMQGRLLLAFLVALEAGWVELGHGRSPWAILAVATLLYAAGRLLSRTDRKDVFETPFLTTAQLLPIAAGAIAIARTLHASGLVWANALPVFLASCFYVLVASHQERRVGPSLLASLFLMAGLASVIAASPFLGVEFYSLAPGLALLALCALLREEMGRDWTRRVFTAGATLVYATPMLALHARFDWSWQAILLVLALLFGAASFSLRSRSLLVVSTAAMLVDLGSFVLFVGRAEPTALWVGGAFLGLLLMGLAAWLEYRREGVLQRIRVFANELQSWS